MDCKEANNKLVKYGQQHVLEIAARLGCADDTELIKQIEQTDFEVIELGKNAAKETERGIITPIEVMSVDEIASKEQEYCEAGTRAIRDGKVGAVLLAGGMGTRLGSDMPKGVYDIGITKVVYIFECLVNNLKAVVDETGAYIHLFVMTSEKNNDITVDFFKEHNYFGYPAEYIHFFMQEMAPSTDYDGKVLMEAANRIATSPNGNGGWYSSIISAGLHRLIEKEGIEWLNVFAVDNVLQKIADPCYVGATIMNNCVSASKVIRKVDKEEKVGVLCLEDGHPSIVEYYELTEEMKDAVNEKGELAYNYGVILNYLFKVEELDKIVAMKLPPHVVEKKIPYIDDDGNMINPEEPNGLKYETLILDMIKMLDTCLGYEVVREKEFAPIKNKEGVDSVDSARELLKINGVVI